MNTEHKLAVSIAAQRKASLYGIAAVLVASGKVKNKKKMKRIVKRLRKDVLKEVGAGGEELLMQNRGALEMVLKGFREDPKRTVDERKAIINATIESWYGVYTRGLKLWGWEDSL